MPKGRDPKLTDEARAFVVQSLACWDPPSVVAAAVKKDFGVVVTPQAIEAYDPNKRAGRNLSEKWRALFGATREAFVKDSAKIGIANKSVRLRIIGRIAEQAESRGNAAMALQAVEQAAKEVGNAYTNRREYSGPDGGPIPATFVDAPPPESREEWLERKARERDALSNGGQDVGR